MLILNSGIVRSHRQGSGHHPRVVPVEDPTVGDETDEPLHLLRVVVGRLRTHPRTAGVATAERPVSAAHLGSEHGRGLLHRGIVPATGDRVPMSHRHQKSPPVDRSPFAGYRFPPDQARGALVPPLRTLVSRRRRTPRRTRHRSRPRHHPPMSPTPHSPTHRHRPTTPTHRW